MANFETWQHQTLVDFAKESTERMNLLNAEMVTTTLRTCTSTTRPIQPTERPNKHFRKARVARGPATARSRW